MNPTPQKSTPGPASSNGAAPHGVRPSSPALVASRAPARPPVAPTPSSSAPASRPTPQAAPEAPLWPLKPPTEPRHAAPSSASSSAAAALASGAGAATAPSRPAPSKPAAPASASSAEKAAATVAKSGPSVPYATPSAAKPGKPAKGPMLTQRAKLYLLGGLGASVVLAGFITLMVRKPWRPEPPRLNAPPVDIARYAASSGFYDLPFEKQLQYMEILDDKEPALEQAYSEKKLDDDEFRKALQAAYFGKHLPRMKKFHEKSPGNERDAYVDKLLQKKGGKGDGKPDKPGVAGSTTKPEKSDNLSPLSADEIKRDDSQQEEQVNSWPKDIREQWFAYKGAIKNRKEFHKSEKDRQKERERAAASKASE